MPVPKTEDDDAHVGVELGSDFSAPSTPNMRSHFSEPTTSNSSEDEEELAKIERNQPAVAERILRAKITTPVSPELARLDKQKKRRVIALTSDSEETTPRKQVKLNRHMPENASGGEEVGIKIETSSDGEIQYIGRRVVLPLKGATAPRRVSKSLWQ